MCLRGCLIDKYSSFTRIFVCLVKQTDNSDSFQNPFSKQTLLSPKENVEGIAAHGDSVGSHSGDSAGDNFLRGLDSKQK